jgi:hypothetical protein
MSPTLLLLLSCVGAGKPGDGACGDHPGATTGCTGTDSGTDTPTDTGTDSGTDTRTDTPTEPTGCPPTDEPTDTTGVDADGDGWTVEGGDCDDADPSVHPGAYDVPADGIDQDCDGFDACVADATYPDYINIDRDGDIPEFISLCDTGEWDSVVSIEIDNTRRLSDLGFLSCVCRVEHSYVRVKKNDCIRSLHGLEHLTEIDSLEITDNPTLADLSALSRLESLGYVYLWDLPITNLDVFSNVTTWSDVVMIGGLPLTDLSGLEGMVEVQDLWLYLGDIVDLTGLQNLVSVEQELGIRYSSLISLSGLDSLESAEDLVVSKNFQLTEVGPLPSLRAAGFWIYDNASLESFSTPPSLEVLYGLSISGPALVSVSASPLSGTVDSLGLLDSPLLTDLSGLSPLSSVGTDMQISGNDSLTSLDGLHNIEWIGGDLEITDNVLLPQAEIDAFIDSVGRENIDGTVTVEGNGE